MTAGRLTGVGVGPGDPDLLTVRATQVIAAADVIAYHCAAHGRSIARAAIRSRRARSVSTTKSHGCEKPTEGAWWAAARTRPSTSAGTGSGRNPRRTSRRSAITR